MNNILTTISAIEAGVVLDGTVQKIRNLICDVDNAYHLDSSPRFVGGWVRDALLGTVSEDIDVALEGITGVEFCKAICNLGHGKEFHIVKANPDQSKHLETATMRLFGLDVDFVNLRSESYTDSRIPTMQFGTPEQDALRRDLTINGLFLNLITMQIEDYVGGIADLRSMILRTPMEPRQTFIDDPLRIIRLFRFFSRFPLSSIDSTTMDAINLPEVLVALRDKVSPERVQEELKKLAVGAKPDEAFDLMHHTGVMKVIFDCPEFNCFPNLLMDQLTPHHSFSIWVHTVEVIKNFKTLLDDNGVTGDELGLCILAALFHDFGKADDRCWGYKIWAGKETIPNDQITPLMKLSREVRRTYHNHESYSADATHGILNKLKFGNNDRRFICKLVAEHMGPHSPTWSDKALRRMLNRWGPQWKLLWFHALADSAGSGTPHVEDIAKKHINMARAEELIITDPISPFDRKNVLSGDILMEMFPELDPKSGYLKELQTWLMEARFKNPAITEDGARRLVKNRRKEIIKKYEEPKCLTT